MREFRVEISPLERWRDCRGQAVGRQIEQFLGIKVDNSRCRAVYTIVADIDDAAARRVAAAIANPVLESWTLGQSAAEFDWLIAIGFRPGVTDNVGRSAKELVGDVLGRHLRDDEHVFSSREYLLSAPGMSRETAEHVAKDMLANELIETITVLPHAVTVDAPIPANLPFMPLVEAGGVANYDLEVSDAELVEISRRGVLALSLGEMKAIQKYFREAEGRAEFGLGNAPTDVELEVLAQTWSEHCKHKIFNALIDYEDEFGKHHQVDSCFKSFIKKSTDEIGAEVDWLVSVFHDNAGVIAFDDELDLVYKVETHNSPSALDPYGGAMTGIVGVNRDPMGTGQGANLLINVWGYCLGSPFTPAADVPPGLFHPRRLRDGIHKGVIDGGNQSGIPYGLGWECFDERYLGKPLVYCGTVGTLPKRVGAVEGFDKSIKPGDLVVMAGGRVGKDGIHGATFSSEELHQDSPTQAVQIGDPITQKMMGDFIYEARSRGLYRFITDNGAGGLSSSIGEMASICGGCRVDLAKAPLKYPGLRPWEILVSEAQERMSFAVPPENIEEFKRLASRRDVEITVLGEFSDDGFFHVFYNDRTVGRIAIEFMHDGLPRLELKAKWTPPNQPAPRISRNDSMSLAEDWLKLMGGLNICSNEYKARQYDHEVKGLSVVKPFVGVGGDVAGDATVSMVEPLGRAGVVLAAAVLPRYSDIDTYHMVAASIDLAARRAIAAGAKLEPLAGLDNFCWPDPVSSAKNPDGEYKLAQLVRANQALYDYTKAFKIPCVSGKDSMKNDCELGGRRISIPPTMLFSVIGKIDDVGKALTLDAKRPGDLVCVMGLTRAELGGGEYLAMLGQQGGAVPRVDAETALDVLRAAAAIVDGGLANSMVAPGSGGLAVALAKTAMAGRLGMSINLDAVPAEGELTTAEILFSESASRMLITLAPENLAAVGQMAGHRGFAVIGEVVGDGDLTLDSSKFAGAPLSIPLEKLLLNYQSTLEGV